MKRILQVVNYNLSLSLLFHRWFYIFINKHFFLFVILFHCCWFHSNEAVITLNVHVWSSSLHSLHTSALRLNGGLCLPVLFQLVMISSSQFHINSIYPISILSFNIFHFHKFITLLKPPFLCSISHIWMEISMMLNRIFHITYDEVVWSWWMKVMGIFSAAG